MGYDRQLCLGCLSDMGAIATCAARKEICYARDSAVETYGVGLTDISPHTNPFCRGQGANFFGKEVLS